MADFKLDFIANTEALTDGLKAASNGLQELGEQAIQTGKDTQKAFTDTGGVDRFQKSLASQLLSFAKYETQLKSLRSQLSKAFEPSQIAALNTQIDQTTDALIKMDEQFLETTRISSTLRGQLIQNKDALSLLEQQGLETSDTYEQLAISTEKLQKQINDTNERIRFMASDTAALEGLIDITKGAAAGFAVVEGASALFGSSNEQVEKVLLKVNAAMAILNGLQEIQNVLKSTSAARLSIEIGLQKLKIFLLGSETLATEGLTVAQIQAANASRVLRAALLSTGILAVAAALIYITKKVWDFTSATEDQVKALENLNSELETTREFLEGTLEIYDQENKVAVLRAKQIGATEEEIRTIERDGRLKRLRELELYHKQAQTNLQNFDATRFKNAEDAEEAFNALADEVTEAAKKVREERAAREIAIEEDKLERIEEANEAAEKRREEAEKAQKKRDEEAKKRAEDEIKRTEALISQRSKLYDIEQKNARDANAAFKKLFEERVEDEEQIFDDRLKLLNDLEQIRLLELDLEFEQGDKSIAQAKEIARQKLEVEIDFARQKLELLRASGGSVLDIAALELQIKKAQNEIAALETEENPIFKALGLGGLSSGEVDGIMSNLNVVKDSIRSVLTELNQAALQTNANLLNNIDQQIRATESNIEQQADLQAKGLANNLDREMGNLEELQRVREEALEKHKKLQRQQLNIDAATQISSMIVAAANIFKATSNIPFVGVPLAIAAIASMFAAFAVAQVKARQSISQQTFREGGMVKGRRHSSGGERYYSDSGNLVEIEEAEWVTRREQTAKYLPLLKAINSDTLKHMNLQELLANTGVRLNPDKINEVRLIQKSNQEAELRHRISIENEIGNKETAKLREAFDAFYSEYKKKGDMVAIDGYLIEKRGNRTIKHKTNGGKG